MTQRAKIGITIFVLFIITFIVLSSTGYVSFISFDGGGIKDQALLRELWDAGSYYQIITFTDERLADNPLDPNYLLYRGLAHFYLGEVGFTSTDRSEQLDQSIIYLRKLLLLQHPPQKDKIFYTLGRAYYLKGELYYNLAIEYLLRAMENGYTHNQLFQYLGVVYAEVGDYENSITYFQEALSGNPSTELELELANAYLNAQQMQNTIDIINIIEQKTVDTRLMLKLLLLKSRLSIVQNNFSQAEQLLDAIIADYPNSAEAHFQLGEVFNAYNEGDKARFQWRTAINLDPNHVKALLQLQN